MEFFLANTQVETPDGLVGFYYDRSRDARYWGFVRNYSATAKGVAEINFEEPDAVLVLDSYAKKLTDAELNFVAKEGIKTVLDMQLDFKQFFKVGTMRKIPVMDAQGDLFEIQSKRSFEIAPNASIWLDAVTLANTQVLEIDASRSSVAESGSVYIDHAVPVQNPSKSTLNGTFQAIENVKKLTSFYRNTTKEARILELEMFLSLKTKANTSFTASVVLEVKDASKNVIESRVATQVSFSNAETVREVGASESVSVPKGGEVLLYLSYSNSVSSYSVSYDVAKTYVSVSDEQQDGSYCQAISVYDAFASLVEKMTDGAMSFSSSYLQTKDWYLTNGHNLSGKTKTLSLSFESLFESMNALKNLRVDVAGSVVRLEQKSTVFDSYVYSLEDVIDVRYTLDIDRLYNQVKVSAKNWRSSTPTGNNEANAEVTFSTQLKRATQSLNLVSSLITSSRAIEKVRRRQFDEESANEKKDEESDESIFLIECQGQSAKIYFDSGARYLNQEFSPENTVVAWQWIWAQSGELTAADGVAGWKSKTFVASPQTRYIEPELALINCVESPENFSQIGDIVTYYDRDNGQKYGLVISATHRPFKQGGEMNTFIAAVTLKR